MLDVTSGSARLPAASLAALVRAVSAAAAAGTRTEALSEIAAVARSLTGADVALVRIPVEGCAELEAAAVAGPATLAAELAGTRVPVAEFHGSVLDDLDRAPAVTRRAAALAGASELFLVLAAGSAAGEADGARPEGLGGEAGVSLELLRTGDPFSSVERFVAELCAAQALLVFRAFGSGNPAESHARPALELAGEALAAALDNGDQAGEIVRLSAAVSGATAAILWERRGTELVAVAAHGIPLPETAAAAEALPEVLSDGRAISTTVPLGNPATGILQLLHADGREPNVEQIARLGTFGVRAAAALRSGEQSRELALELTRTRALLELIVQATAELSVAHTLETAVERVSEILGVDRVAVHLRSADGSLEEAAGRGAPTPNAPPAERLLDLALGPARLSPVIEVAGALAVPLVARGDVVGLLAAYPEERRSAGEHETALLAALAAQLAVAVRNAQLHEETTRLGDEREAALAAERAVARRLRALYEISRSFAQSLSLDETLEALARTVVDVLDVDAAIVRMPDERREQLFPHAIHVRDDTLADAFRGIVAHAVPFGHREVQRLFRDGRGFRLRPGARDQFVPGLAPFLEKGWTGAVLPIALPSEVVASLEIYSFRPGSPLTDEVVEAAEAIGTQVALAIDNARLYQQQKQFADTMQRSLLPRARPFVEGLEVGEVYEPSSRVEVGGDLYDFLALDDGRLAVVLGDVTGHGVDATADMAMAKFVFRSLVREHAEPADFLSAANDVICSEIAGGKFISMSYVVVDGVAGTVVAASAGHPPPRLLLADGRVSRLAAHGLVLGIEPGQEYSEVRVELPRGASLVLYTDGVVEARREGELYGDERLDALLAARHDLPARALAAAVAEDAREFAGGDLSDDVAVVVIRRL
jgi:serine phosphatase RsbU (regulator of sigma subunit)